MKRKDKKETTRRYKAEQRIEQPVADHKRAQEIVPKDSTAWSNLNVPHHQSADSNETRQKANGKQNIQNTRSQGNTKKYVGGTGPTSRIFARWRNRRCFKHHHPSQKYISLFRCCAQHTSSSAMEAAHTPSSSHAQRKGAP